jgi:hypothetical protein
MNKTEISEVQRMDSLWPLVILASTLGINWVLYFVLHETDLTALYASVGTASFIAGLLSLVRLEVGWNSEMLKVKLWPFMFTPTVFKAEDIASVSLQTYKPIRDYGGWGLRYSKKNGKAYTVKGNVGLVILLTSGKKVLIGTSQPDKWQPFIALYQKKQ